MGLRVPGDAQPKTEAVEPDAVSSPFADIPGLAAPSASPSPAEAPASPFADIPGLAVDAAPQVPTGLSPEVSGYLQRTGDLDLATRALQGDVKRAALLTRGIQPDTFVEQQRLASETGLPTDTVGRNLQEAKQIAYTNKMSALLSEQDKDGKPRYPYALQWLRDPQNMAAGKDDVEALAQIENTLRSAREENDGTLKTHLKLLGAGLANMATGVLQTPAYGYLSAELFRQAAAVSALPPEKQQEYLDKAQPITVPEALYKNAATNYFNKVASELTPLAASQGLGAAWEKGFGEAAKNIYYNTILNAPQLALLAIAGPVSLPIMGLTSAAQATAEGLEEGKGAAATWFYATASGTAEAAFELPTLQILKGVGAQARQVLGKEGAAAFAKEFAKVVISDAAKEGSSEGATQIVQDLADVITGDNDKLPNIPGNVLQATLVGGLMGAGLGGGGVMTHAIGKRAKYKAELAREVKIEASAEQSKLRARDPERYEAQLDQAFKQYGANDTVLIPLETITEFHQNDPKKVKETLDALGVQEQVPTAEATGAELEVSRAKWVAKFAGTELAKGIAEDLRFGKNAMTEREQKAFDEERAKNFDQVKKEFEKLTLNNELPPEVAKMRQVLMAPKSSGGGGYSAKDADANLLILVEGMARLYGTNEQGMKRALERINVIAGGAPTAAPGQLFQTPRQAPEFYSKLEKTVQEKMGNAATPAQLLATLKDVKAEELDTSGLKGFLAGKDKVSKADVLGFLQENQVHIKEVVKNDSAKYYEIAYGDGWFARNPDTGEALTAKFKTEDEAARAAEKAGFNVPGSKLTADTKHKTWVLPGGENYREVLFTLPVTETDTAKIDAEWQAIMDKYIIGDTFSAADSARLKELSAERDASEKARPQEFTSDHWDESNILAFVRLDDRVDADGKKVLFVEEIQSDWHQAGRKKGYGQKVEKTVEAYYRTHTGQEVVIGYGATEAEALANADPNWKGKVDINYRTQTRELSPGVPNAPFKKTWHEFAFKKILAMAVSQGYDRVAWTTGEQQAERYDLSKQVEAIQYQPIEDIDGNVDEYAIRVIDLNGSLVLNKDYTKAELPDVVGKDVAARIIKGEGEENKVYGQVGAPPWAGKVLKDSGLKVGGEGMKGFYDKIIPDFVRKYTKKWGAKVGETSFISGKQNLSVEHQADQYYHVMKGSEDISGPIETEDEAKEFMSAYGGIERAKVHSLDITPEMRKAIQTEGQPLFQKQENKPLGSVQFTNTQTLINLFTTANRSTLLHEMGHIFVNEMQLLANNGQATEQMKTDLETLIAFAGGKLDTKGQETLARAFEAYLMEGKAPSVKLADAFSRFKNWLLAIYQNIKGLNVNITDDVRQVFDRLLATEEEIREAKSYYEAKGTILSSLPETSPEEKASINAKSESANQKTFERQVKRTMNAYLEAIGGEQELKSLAERELSELPVYKALSDTEELSPEELAIKYDFESPEAMLDAMKKAPKFPDAVTARTKELLKQREDQIREALSKNESIPAEEAYHNEDRLAFLIAELQLLRKKLPQAQARRERQIEAKSFHDAAIERLSAFQVKKAIRYGAFSQAEQVAANRAYSLALDGDFVNAHQAKNRQIVNHVMVIESVKIRNEIEKAEKAYTATALKTALSKVNKEYADAAKHIIGQFGLNENIEAPEPGTKLDLAPLDEALPNLIPGWITDGVKPNNYSGPRDLTVQQFRELHEAVQTLLHAGSDQMKNAAFAKEWTTAIFVEKSLERMRKLKDAPVRSEDSRWQRTVMQRVDGLASELKMAQFFSERMDNYEFDRTQELGPLHQAVFEVSKASAEANEIKTQAFKKAEPHWEALYKAVARIENELGARYFTIEGVPFISGPKAPGRKFWTAERIIAAVLNMGNAGNKLALMNAYSYSTEQLNKLASMLQPKELQAIQGIWDTTQTLFQPIDNTLNTLYGRRMTKVEAEPLTVTYPNGESVTLKGGYHPLVFDRLLNDTVDKRKEAQDLDMNNRQNAVFRKVKPGDGFTNERTPAGTHALPPRLSLDVWFEHITDSAHYVTHAPILQDLHRISMNKEWADGVRTKAGEQMYKAFRTWITDQAAAVHVPATEWQKAIESHRVLASAAILGLNFRSGAKQLLSMWNGATELGMGYMIKGVLATVKGSSFLGITTQSETWQKIESLSKIMKQRNKGFDETLYSALDQLSPTATRFNIFGHDITRRDLSAFAFSWIQYMDRTAVAPVWLGAFEKGLDTHAKLPEQERIAKAADFADLTVQNTQAMMTRADMSALMRAPGLIRLYTMFSSERFKAGNRLAHKLKAVKEGGISQTDFWRYIIYELGASALTIPIGALLLASLKGGNSDDDRKQKRELWTSALVAPAGNALQGIPFASDMLSALQYNQSVGRSAAFEGVDRTLHAAKSFWTESTKDGKAEWNKAVWDSARAIEFFVGVPATNVAKDILKAHDAITGKHAYDTVTGKGKK